MYVFQNKLSFDLKLHVVCLMVLELASLEKKKKKKERKKKENNDFRFFSEFFFSACIKLSGNQRTYLYSGGSGLSIDIHFVDIELSYDVLSPLPIVLSKISTTLIPT